MPPSIAVEMASEISFSFLQWFFGWIHLSQDSGQLQLQISIYGTDKVIQLFLVLS